MKSQTISSTLKYQSASVILKPQQNGEHYLILGDSEAPLNKKVLQQFSIGSIISIGRETVPSNKFPNINYHSFFIRDQKEQSIVGYFQEIIGIIDKGRETGGVLIHCKFGVSRSASFTIAYIMVKLGMGFEEAKKYVKERRPCISPNKNFVQELQEFQKSMNGKEQ